MAYARNGKTLLRGGGGEQGTGTTEENAPEFAFIQLIQQIPAEGDGTATAAGTSCMNILHCVVEDQRAAVGQFSSQIEIVPLAQLQQNFFTDLSQITRNDQIEILRLSAQILHMGLYGLECSRGHCQVWTINFGKYRVGGSLIPCAWDGW